MPPKKINLKLDRLITSADKFWDGKPPSFSILTCPFCKIEYVHSGTPEYIDSHDNYEARPGTVRGDVIVIPMECIEGHTWALCFGFHKGHTFVWMEEGTERTIDR